jgi:Pyruvate/2-oxoacid:ferredoxin oxidoreductase delta subunit
MKFKHNKTGNIYRLLAHAIDCTNSRDGTACIVYCPDDAENTIYVREDQEFFDKFTEIHEIPD